MSQTPLLFFGDSPDLQTGLGRIGRDLASMASSLPEFRVGFLGRGGCGSRQLPFAQYNFDSCWQWGEQHIQRVWADFAGKERGVVFTIWDPTRLHWFACPQRDGLPRDLYSFLTSGAFERWGYFPVDGTGVGDRLTTMAQVTLAGYDRLAAYTTWGQQVLSRSVSKPVDWMPHGINLEVWRQRDRVAARMAMEIDEGDFVVGCVMTNQPRKDWALAFTLARELRVVIPNLKLWAHTDVLERDNGWSFHGLAADFGVGDCIRVTLGGTMSDKQLSYWYSGCDITVLPSLGEGFGYPIVESLACGVPVVHGNYGGGAELVPEKSWLVEPQATRLEGLHNTVRPVYDPVEWVKTVKAVSDSKVQPDYCRAAVEHLDWVKLWPAVWKKWFEGGLKP